MSSFIAEPVADVLEVNDGITPEIIFQNAKGAIQKLLDTSKIDEAGDMKRLFDFSYHQHDELKVEKENMKQIKEKLQDTERKLSFVTTFNEDLQDTISQLKTALEDTWRELDASRTREQNFQDELDNTKRFDITTMKASEDVGQYSGVGGSIDRFKQIIIRERDRLSGELREVERRLVTQRLYAETVGQLCQRLEENNAKLNKDVEAYEITEVKKNKKIMYLKDQVNTLTKTKVLLSQKCEAFEGRISELQLIIRSNENDMAKLHQSIDKIKSRHLHFQKQIQTIFRSLRLCVHDKNTQDLSVKILQQNIKNKDYSVILLTKKLHRMSAYHRSVTAQNMKLNKENSALNQRILKQNSLIQRGQRDILAYIKTKRKMERIQELLTHERDKLRSEVKKLAEQIFDMKHLNILKNRVISNLQIDISRLKNRIEELKRSIQKIEKERGEQIREVAALNDHVDNLMEQMQMKTDYINDLKHQLTENQKQVMELEILLEKARSERLVLQNSLQRCSEDRSTLKSLQAKTNHQVAQQTEEIFEHHKKMTHLNLKLDKVEREKHELSSQLHDVKQSLKDTKYELKTMTIKNEKLHKDLEVDEKRFQRVIHQLEETKKLKNLIGLQIMRRNDEISLLRERQSILNETLNRGHSLYNQRMEDIRLLKLKISKMSLEKDIMRKTVENSVEMRNQLARTTRALNSKEIECTALAEQVKLPTNVHRWRILRGSDPERYSALVKIRVLQKKIIRLYVEGANREQAFQNFQKAHEKLKEFVEKIPNKEVKENLIQTQMVIKEREKKLKAVTAELTTKEIDIKTMEVKIDELNKIMRAVKLDLIKVKENDKNISIKKCLANIIGKLGKVY